MKKPQHPVKRRVRCGSKRKSNASSSDESDNSSSPVRRRPSRSKSFAGVQRSSRRSSCSSLRRSFKRRSAACEVSGGPRRNSIQWLVSNRVRAVSGRALASREPEFDAVYQFLYDGLVSGVSKCAVKVVFRVPENLYYSNMQLFRSSVGLNLLLGSRALAKRLLFTQWSESFAIC